MLVWHGRRRERFQHPAGAQLSLEMTERLPGMQRPAKCLVPTCSEGWRGRLRDLALPTRLTYGVP